MIAHLLEPQHEVSFGEGPVAHSTAVIVTQALLVDNKVGKYDVSCLVECVDVVFECGR